MISYLTMFTVQSVIKIRQKSLVTSSNQRWNPRGQTMVSLVSFSGLNGKKIGAYTLLQLVLACYLPTSQTSTFYDSPPWQ